MTTDQKIDLFFKNPAEQPDGSIQGVLYLLRREVQDCFIGKVVPEDQVIAESQKDRHRLFATVMVIMAGIDLLAKFYAGSDENGGVGSRIRTFAREFVFTGLPSAQLFSEVLSGVQESDAPFVRAPEQAVQDDADAGVLPRRPSAGQGTT